MAKFGNFSANDLKKLQRKLDKLKKENTDAFVAACAKELAARLLSKVIDRTPIGHYPEGSGKVGGTLRRGWTAGQGASPKGYAESLRIEHIGDLFVIEIINPIEYASYVEYGHRTKDHRGWVQGKLFLTKSEQEIRDITPNVLAAKIEKFFGECFDW